MKRILVVLELNINHDLNHFFLIPNFIFFRLYQFYEDFILISRFSKVTYLGELKLFDMILEFLRLSSYLACLFRIECCE